MFTVSVNFSKAIFEQTPKLYRPQDPQKLTLSLVQDKRENGGI